MGVRGCRGLWLWGELCLGEETALVDRCPPPCATIDPSSTEASPTPPWLSIKAMPCLNCISESLLDPLASDPSYCSLIDGMSIAGEVAMRFRVEPFLTMGEVVGADSEDVRGTTGTMDRLPNVLIFSRVGDVGELGGEDSDPDPDVGPVSSSPARSRTTPPKFMACIRAWARASASRRL